MRPATAVVLALAALVLAANLAPAGAVAAHPTPPGTATPSAPNRTPTGDGTAMRMETAPNGTVVNANADRLPPGCAAVRGTERVTIRAGVRFAEPGEAFAFDRDRLQVPPCTRVVVTLVNEDAVRHQFMVHGLPRAVYPMGMFAVEVDGPGRLAGAFVTPARNYTLRAHCSLPQHEQKGMVLDVVVGDGSAGSTGGHAHAGAGHTHTAGGHDAGVAAPGFGPVAGVAALAGAALLVRRRLTP